MNQLRTFQPARPILLTAAFTLILSLNFSPSPRADDDYVYRDENQDIITLPNRPVIPFSQPGGLAPKASSHTPQITIKSRRDGLEDVRILLFHFPQIPDPGDKDSLKTIYLIDKDGLVVGCAHLKSDQRDARIILNSVINFVTVYVECSRHGLWMKNLSIPL